MIAVSITYGPLVAVGAEDPLDEVVARAMRGDRRAFGVLYERFHRVVHAIALARVGARDASDIVQDVFAYVWAKLTTLREPAAFPGWITTIARSKAVDHARKVRPTTDADELTCDQPPHAEAARALQAIRELPEAYRETLIMRLVEGLTGPEIAERTQLTAESVRVNLHRGMKLLRERLEPDAKRGAG